MQANDKTKPLLQSELLCIADSNWILGHWYINCMLNGRELTDFTSMAGIAEEKLGHTRALFRFLEDYFELPEFQLEFGREANRIHSPEFLDLPPENWADFITTLYLADLALWRFSATFMEGNFAPVANLVKRFGEECYFHQLCLDGWIKHFTTDEKTEAGRALARRLPQALAWFGSEQQSSADLLLEQGSRAEPIWSARLKFLADSVGKLAPHTGISSAELNAIAAQDLPENRDPLSRRQRGSKIPARLWESVIPTSADAQIARRTLAVSAKDNIDLSGTIKKDETEPVFEAGRQVST